MAKKGTEYVCSECGATFYRWSGRCPNCLEWDTLQETGPGSDPVSGEAEAAVSVRLADVDLDYQHRLRTGIAELDRVLGGGLLLGSAVLLGGAPGVGKSTILLQAAGRMAAQDVACVYVSCEESLEQVKMRAERLGLEDSDLAVCAETELEAVLNMLAAQEPHVVIVDSIQRVGLAALDSTPGSLKQVSTCGTALVEHCKRNGAALFLIGHVTKRGVIAGPRALEHLVDTVLYFESESFQSLRILRAAKNRFGAVNEIGVFEMTGDGLREVANPSELFLAERDESATGSVVTAAMEGSRALLVEIQALVGPPAYGTPERKVTGVDYRRFSMMLSVLERRAGLELGKCDAFVNVAGGIRVPEPAADLPLVLALASSFTDRAFPPGTVAVGEVGLGGEVRAVGRLADRLKEARKLGFGRAVVPESNAEEAGRLGLDVSPARHLREAVRLLSEPEGAPR
ncbi:MAG: DNA repair protein RadA [Candidatus Brocadiia bacterium]